MCLNELDHLRDSFCRQNRKEICYQQELVGLTFFGGTGAELAERDALAVIRTTSAAVDKRRVEPVHVEVLVVDEEAFAYRRVPVIESVHVEPEAKSN